MLSTDEQISASLLNLLKQVTRTLTEKLHRPLNYSCPSLFLYYRRSWPVLLKHVRIIKKPCWVSGCRLPWYTCHTITTKVIPLLFKHFYDITNLKMNLCRSSPGNSKQRYTSGGLVFMEVKEMLYLSHKSSTEDVQLWVSIGPKQQTEASKPLRKKQSLSSIIISCSQQSRGSIRTSSEGLHLSCHLDRTFLVSVSLLAPKTVELYDFWKSMC